MKGNYLTKGWIRDVEANKGWVLTRCLQGSAQCFAGANRDLLAGDVQAGEF